LYVDVFGNYGVEYPSDFGPIDILATDRQGAFVVVEVNTEHYPDSSSGQILKYRNWVKRHLAFGKPVRSYLVGSDIPEHVRYSLADCEDVFLKEYDLNIKLKDVPKIMDLEHTGGGAEKGFERSLARTS
jgi:RecB family endonuclease NucS